MPGMPTDFAALRLSSDHMPERDRVPFFRDVFGRSIARHEIEPVPGTSFRVDVTMRALPGLKVWTGEYSALRLMRTRELLADGSDDIAFCTDPGGGTIVSQLGRELTMRGGDAVLLSGGDPMSVTTSPLSRHVGIGLSRKVLAHMVPGLEDAFLRPVPRDTEALDLLRSYIGILSERDAMATPGLQHLVVTHVKDLVALALGASRDAAEVANGRGVRAARLHAIKADIINDQGQRDLTLSAIAVRHGVTPRYVQMLFESEGTTFSQYLLEQRLARAHRLLGDPRLAQRTISAIAFEAGFGDLSHFNRAFRRRFGEAPSDVRAAAGRERRR
jgi:AraC-like DNA-binding protein